METLFYLFEDYYHYHCLDIFPQYLPVPVSLLGQLHTCDPQRIEAQSWARDATGETSVYVGCEMHY